MLLPPVVGLLEARLLSARGKHTRQPGRIGRKQIAQLLQRMSFAHNLMMSRGCNPEAVRMQPWAACLRHRHNMQRILTSASKQMCRLLKRRCSACGSHCCTAISAMKREFLGRPAKSRGSCAGSNSAAPLEAAAPQAGHRAATLMQPLYCSDPKTSGLSDQSNRDTSSELGILWKQTRQFSATPLPEKAVPAGG